MATNYIKPGEHLTWTATTDTASGAGIALGNTLGVSLVQLTPGERGEAAVEGVWELPKVPAAVIPAWSTPVWDVSAGAFTASAGAKGDLLGAALAVAPAPAGSATVQVRLLPGSGSVKP